MIPGSGVPMDGYNPFARQDPHPVLNFCIMTNVNSLDVLAIQNVLSRYCQALDSKDFDMLSKVFDPDVDANYPFNSNMKSLVEVQDAIKKRYL